MANQPDHPQVPAPGDKPDRSKPERDATEGLEGSRSGAAEKKTTPSSPLPSDEAIDLGIPGEGGELSGISVIEWASLSQGTRNTSTPSQPGVESPSDADLIAQLADRKDAAPSTIIARSDDMAAALSEPLSGSHPPAKAPATMPEVALPPAAAEKDAGGEDAVAADAFDSGIDLSEAVPAETPPSPPRAKEGDSAIDLTTEAFIFEEEVVSPAPKRAAQAEDSAIDLSDDAVVVEGPSGAPKSSQSASDSGIELAADAIVEEPASDVTPPPAKGEDSAIDLTGEAVIVEEPVSPGKRAGAPDTDVALLDASEGIDIVAQGVEPAAGVKQPAATGDSGMDLIAESVILEEPATPAANGGSGRDLIAEGLESGVDLSSSGKDSKKPTAEEDALEHLLANAGPEDESSAVDLGSVHNMPTFKEEDVAALRARQAGRDSSSVRLGEPTGAESADVIDLGMAAAESGASPAKKAPAGKTDEPGIDIDLSHVVAEGDDIEVEGAGPKKGKPAAREGQEEGEKPPKVGQVVAEEGKAAEEEPAEEAEQPKKEKPRGRAGAWLGGTVLGAVIGSAACLGVWVAGVEPPGAWRDMVGLAEKKAPPKTGGPQGGGNVPPGNVSPGRTFADAMGHIKSGDLDKVTPEDLAKADETKAEQLTARAEYRWRNYLRGERGKDARAPLKADAAPVKDALADLDKAVAAGNADALFLRGQIHELTGKKDLAKKDYQLGVEKFKADASLRVRFETALLVMDLEPKVARLAPAGAPARLLALLLLAFQPPPKGEASEALEEAGYRFWQAIKLARGGKWADAVKALDEARERHDRRRYLFPGKQQNPHSDPREDIFLRGADEVKAYWTLLARLGNKDYLAAEKGARVPQVDALLEKTEAAARAAVLKDLADKLVKDKVEKPDDLIKLVSDERKANKDALGKLQSAVEDQQKKVADTQEKLTRATKDLSSNRKLLEASVACEKELRASLASANSALEEVGKTLGVKFTDPKASREAVMKEVREMKRVAGIVDPKGALRKLEGELEADRAKLKQRWAPEQMLAFWLPILQADRSRTDLQEKAMLDAGRVLDDSSASEVLKGRALAIRGLVLRNEEKFDDAKEVLTRAKAALADARGGWSEVVDEALREASNPAADVARKASVLASQGRQREAVALLARGLKYGDARKGPLYAQRALIYLEAARAKGPLAAGDPLVASARRDAAAAAKEGLAEGHYALGRLNEELGRTDDAIRSYRAAVTAHGARDEQGGRYRVALARALLKSRAGESPAVRPLPPPTRTGKAPAKQEKGPVRRVSGANLVGLMMALTVQAVDLPLSGPKVREAEKLADEVLAMGDKAPFDVRAQALAVKGLYTRALAVYTAGLREKGLLAPAHANALLELIGNHPMLRRPESLAIPEPAEAEKHYAAGLNFFFRRNYPDAEKEFLSAVRNDNGDARYYYYLGLSRLAQGNRDAYEDFDQASRLERLGRPDQATVSSALERVQGPMRRTLNTVRTRPVKDRAR
jgi:hypothetical protein